MDTLARVEPLDTIAAFPNAAGAEEAEAPYYFLHIPKTGGVTLSTYVRSLFLPAEFCNPDGLPLWEHLLKRTPEEWQRCKIINGHFAGYLFKICPLRLRYFTLLRDPLARALSHYEHVRRHKSHYFHALAMQLGTFGAYLRDERTQPTIVNFQLRNLSATFDPIRILGTLNDHQIAEHELEKRLDTQPMEVAVDNLLKTARARLDQMCFVGVTERFEESLRLLCEVFGWPRPALVDAQNVNPRPVSVDDLPGRDLRLLKRLNEADIELYQTATARFERDWRRSRFVYPHLQAFVSYAQNCEDVLLHRALRDIESGTYIDVGANDPSGDSVTKAFYDVGWRGINIEPMSSQYEALVKYRPWDVNICAAAGAAEEKRAFYEISGTGLSTLDRRIAQRHERQGFKVTEEQVQVRTLQSILVDTPKREIHFLKIDVEGWEGEVLAGIDLSVHRPWIILVEATRPNTRLPSHQSWEPLLLAQGYTFVFFDGLNRYYLARERRNLRRAFSRPVNSGDFFIRASEVAAVRGLRDAHWNLRRQNLVLKERDARLAGAHEWAQSADAYAKELERERDGLRVELQNNIAARAVDRKEAERQLGDVGRWAQSADAYAKSLAAECDNLRVSLKATNDAREEQLGHVRQEIDDLRAFSRSLDDHGKSLRDECQRLRQSLTTANDALETERAAAADEVRALTKRVSAAELLGSNMLRECESLRVVADETRKVHQAERRDMFGALEKLKERAISAETRSNALGEECERLRATVNEASAARELERSEALLDINLLKQQLATAQGSSGAVREECERQRVTLKGLEAAREAYREEALKRVELLNVRAVRAEARQSALEVELERTRGDWRAARRERVEALGGRLAGLARELNASRSANKDLQTALQRERDERRLATSAWTSERDCVARDMLNLQEQLRQTENAGGAQRLQLEALRQEHSRLSANWRAERESLSGLLRVTEDRLEALRRHWAVRLFINEDRQGDGINVQRNCATGARKIGLFTIASKNYLAYVRVLLKSVAEVHPEYSLYLCLVDKVSGAFDPALEPFKVVECEELGINNFEDMAVRYDIMELNTAVKPFMFRWLLENSDLDSVIYLDPDIRAYSRFDQLEAVLASGASVVLTPHITAPIEDGKSPDDYSMLQAGAFNLGFAAINRVDEAWRFVEWWGRRLVTGADADFSRNLFTDQRWCDLAPCFLDQMRVLKSPGYNVAYWNLAQRTVTQANGQWIVNGEPLTFFHFSGVNASKENIVSKHQNRFDWKSLPNCKPLFDAYREEILREGWEDSRCWEYAYERTKEGVQIPSVVRRFYRRRFPISQTFTDTSATAKLLQICNASSNLVPFDDTNPISELMYAIYQQRPDLQATFNLSAREGRSGFRAWYASAAAREYGMPTEFIPHACASSNLLVANPESALDGSATERDPPRSEPPQKGSTRRKEGGATSSREILDATETWESLPLSVKRALAPAVARLLTEQRSELVDNVRAPESSEIVESPCEARWPKVQPGGRIGALRGPGALPQLLGDDRYISLLMQMIWSSRKDLQSAFNLETAEGQVAFAAWFEASARREYGLDSQVPNYSDWSGTTTSRDPTRTKPAALGANLVGYAHAELGMGEHVRMSAAALALTSINFGVVNFAVGVASRQQAAVEHGSTVTGNPYAANIFHINADQMLTSYCHLGHKFYADHYNIGYWAWELAKCPREWLPVIKMIDEIWAPSRFIQQAFADQADIPVEYMPLCVTLPPFTVLDRQHFGLPDRAFVFLYTFDFYSFLLRKNPFDAIRAFKLAFPRKVSGVRLVLKAMNGDEGSPLWQDMMELIDGDSRIIVINRTMDRREVLALFAISDCFVSLHRSEGFGRGPAEAMYLGKPVIVTNYSGNVDFTLPSNSCPVNFSLIRVEDGQYPFCEGQQWAAPDVEHAAWYMKKLRSDSAYARKLGDAGEKYVREHFDQRTIGELYASRLRKLGLA